MTNLALNEFAGVRAALGQRVADAKFLTKGRRNHRRGADSDALSASSDASDIIPCVFHLTYEDAGGFLSERVVTVRRIERRATGLYLHAFCHLALAPRCFVVERILEIYDVSTGEAHDRPSTFFESHPIFLTPKDPVGEALKICRHEINVLTVVGASDGLFDPDEQDVLLVHVFNRCDHIKLDEGDMRRLLALVAPDAHAFSSSLVQLAQFKAGDIPSLRRTLRKMVDADGMISPSEVTFVTEIERVLGPR